MNTLEFWYPWYPIVYRAATRKLSCLEDGAYRRLLDEYYITRQPLDDDEEVLADICKLSVEDWVKIAPRIKAFFTPRNGKLYHKVANLELDTQDARKMRRSSAASKAANARWLKENKNDAQRIDDACDSHGQRIDPLCDSMPQDRTRQDKIVQSPSQDSTRGVAHDAQSASPPGTLPLSEPDPRPAAAPTSPTGEKTDDRTRRNGKRLAPDWRPDQSLEAFAVGLGLDLERTLADFRDYWTDQPDRRGLKLDWSGTWRRWCRDNADRRHGSAAPRQQQGHRATGSSLLDAAAMALDKPHLEP
jgi:uncharacterized protein YdaU (DUF1376 family)